MITLACLSPPPFCRSWNGFLHFLVSSCWIGRGCWNLGFSMSLTASFSCALSCCGNSCLSLLSLPLFGFRSHLRSWTVAISGRRRAVLLGLPGSGLSGCVNSGWVRLAGQIFFPLSLSFFMGRGRSRFQLILRFWQPTSWELWWVFFWPSFCCENWW